ncbi:MAG TPA: hypothetical protein VF779_09605 [Pyrinomonadaceae bacterium]
MRVFYSSERSRLVSLPEFASNGNWDELYARGHREKAFSSAGSATNEKSLTLTPNFQNSSQTYYRIAKEIEQGNAEAGLNPFVWSEIFVYNRGNPPPPPSACTQPDLQPAPEDDDITVFSDLSGSLSDSAGNTYIKTARVWCSGFFDGSGQLLPGNVSGNDSNLGEIRQLLITLPPITWGVTETNNVNVNTAFNCSLFRRGESNAIATFNVPSLAAGDTFNGPPFTDRGTRIVFLFPSQGLDACFVKTFDHVQGNLDVKEREYEVRVDTGSAVAECSESNNRKTYNNTGSATFISP